MGSVLTWIGRSEADDDMARAKTQPIDQTRVDAIVFELQRSAHDRDAFKRVTDELAADARATAQEIIAAAHKFVGGERPKTKKAALTALGRERLRLAHAKAKAGSAAKTRVW